MMYKPVLWAPHFSVCCILMADASFCNYWTVLIIKIKCIPTKKGLSQSTRLLPVSLSSSFLWVCRCGVTPPSADVPHLSETFSFQEASSLFFRAENTEPRSVLHRLQERWSCSLSIGVTIHVWSRATSMFDLVLIIHCRIRDRVHAG